jgi:Cu/Ag efflux protein CusF
MATRYAFLVLASLATLPLAGCASDTSGSATPSTAAAAETIEGADRVERRQAIEVTATVKKIDYEKRRVTLALPEGREVELTAGPEARNFDQVKAGDQVRVTYYESLVVQVRQPGEATPGASARVGTGRAEPGAAPGAVAISTATLTTTVRAIDREKQTITIELASGDQQTLPVQNPANLDKVKVGDLLEITLNEALAISVEKQ